MNRDGRANGSRNPKPPLSPAKPRTTRGFFVRMPSPLDPRLAVYHALSLGVDHMIWFWKPVIAGSALSFALTSFGVGTDIGAADGTGDNTVPHVVGTVATTTNSISVSAVYVANMVTGDEVRMPPRDPREYAAFVYPPASNYIYITGRIPGSDTDDST